MGKERMSCTAVMRGLNMRVTSLLFLLLFLLPPTSEAAELGWMKVDGDGTPTPADHQDICDSVYQLSRAPRVEDILYHDKMIPGMHCDFEEEDCQWTTVPNMEQRKSGETGLVRIQANERRYGKNKDGTFGKKNKGHYLIFQANYKTSANMDCSPSFSHIESPWIEQSLPHCTLQFNFTMTVEDFQMTNEHAYMEVSLSDKSGAVIPLELYQHNIIGRDQHKDR